MMGGRELRFISRDTWLSNLGGSIITPFVQLFTASLKSGSSMLSLETKEPVPSLSLITRTPNMSKVQLLSHDVRRPHTKHPRRRLAVFPAAAPLSGRLVRKCWWFSSV